MENQILLSKRKADDHLEMMNLRLENKKLKIELKTAYQKIKELE